MAPLTPQVQIRPPMARNEAPSHSLKRYIREVRQSILSG